METYRDRRRGIMKFDEIVKALRLCGETTECISERIGCPYCENTDDCKRQLLFDAADIIEAQQQEIDRLKDENASIRNWNACEEEQYGQLLESDKRRIKLEEQIEAQQQEIKRLNTHLKKQGIY
jgi:predicted RNase H-like nuclease (RuvC/YqgF family)